MSKTDHARISGSHCVGHEERENRKEWFRLPVRRREAEREAIAEGFAEFHAPLDLDERYTPRECMSEWEFLNEYAPEPEERMAGWEMMLLSLDLQDPPAEAVWVSSPVDDIANAIDKAYLRDADDSDLDSVERPSAWLTVPTEQFFDAVGDAYVLEGPDPSRDRTSGKADAYLRVYELARLVCIDTAHMVEYLRLCGEYVAGPLAYVALPVCERMVDLGCDLQAEYGKRTTPQTWAEERAAWGPLFA